MKLWRMVYVTLSHMNTMIQLLLLMNIIGHAGTYTMDSYFFIELLV